MNHKNKRIEERLVYLYRGYFEYLKESQGLETALLFLVDDLCHLQTSSDTTKFDHSGFTKEIGKLIRGYGVHTSVNRYILNKVKQTVFYVNQQNLKPKPNLAAIRKRGCTTKQVSLKEIEQTFAVAKQASDNLFQDLTGDEFLTELKKKTKQFTEDLCREFDIKIPKFKHKTLKSDRPWKNIVTYDTKNEEFNILVNTNKSFKLWEALSYAAHEVCGHVVHLNEFRNSPKLKQHPFLLQICIHTQDSFYTETMAQSVYYFTTKYIYTDESFRASFALFHLRFLVRHYCILKIIKKEFTLQQAAKFHNKYLSHEPATAETYNTLVNDSFFCAQILNYTNGLKILYPALNKSKVHARKTLKRLFTVPFDSKDLRNMVAT